MPETINSFAFVDRDNGAHFEFEGPFEFMRDGGSFEVTMGTGLDDGEIARETAESYTDRHGDIGIAIRDGEIYASGEIEAADLLEDLLCVRVDDAVHVSPADLDYDPRAALQGGGGNGE